MKIIASRENATFKLLRGLAQNPRESRKQGKTLLDGLHLVEVYRAVVGLPEMLVVSESGLRQADIGAAIDQHSPLEPVLLRDSLFNEISPCETPAGILALISIPSAPEPGEKGDCLLLDAVQDAGNVGTLIRSAAAFDVRNIYLGSGCAGAWTPKVLRAAQGAHFSVRIFERADLPKLLGSFDGMKLATVVENAKPIYELPLEGAVAWLIGNEGQGVSPELAALCDQRVTIPIARNTESLNASVAASICMAEAVRQRRVGSH